MEKSKVVHLYPIDYPFETLADRTRTSPPKLILNPEFQRQYKWDNEGNNERASRFIESCLMRIPIPACYFAEQDDSRHLVIDGVQRITTICRFFDNEFALEGLTIFEELNGKYFRDLGMYKSDLEATTMRCIVLRKENPKQLVLEIFARLNQGAVELTKQEIRHAIYPGVLDNLLIELAANEHIANFGLGKQGKQPRNGREGEEMVLRFFAMQDLSDLRDNLSAHLDAYMKEMQNIEQAKANDLRTLFLDTIEKCSLIFGENVFVDTNKAKRKQSLLYYDLLMWSFSSYSLDSLLQHQDSIKTAFSNLCKDPEFAKTTSGGLGGRSSILKRRELWSSYLKTAVE